MAMNPTLLCLAVMLFATAAASTGVRFFSMNRTVSVNDEDWQRWKAKFGRQYGPEEEQYRHKVFKDNLAYIIQHNDNYPQKTSFKMGLNQFADMTLEEFKAFNRLIPIGSDDEEPAANHTVFKSKLHVRLPDNLDWRDEGYVTAVKDQGECGSCYTFSPVVALEGQYFKKTGKLIDFSEQQILDCSRDQGNLGCDGGLQASSFEYIMSQRRGLMAEVDYPYTAVEEICKARVWKGIARIQGYEKVEKSESALQEAVATVGPIASTMHSGLQEFMFYQSGVYSNDKCKSRRFRLDHAVATVGYGTTVDDNLDYWLVKNSWGTSWGEDGYFRLARNANNMCGIATDNSYPVMA